MNPIPATIANDLLQSLWERLFAGKRLSDIELARWRREAKPLERIDPPAFLLISAILAALAGAPEKVVKSARLAERLSMPVSYWNNWRNLLINQGLMREAYTLSQAAWAQHPAGVSILNRLIDLAAAFDDAPVLESALEAWQKLHPGKMHPLLAAHALDLLAEQEPDEDTFALDAWEILAHGGKITALSTAQNTALNTALSKVEE